MKQYTEKSGQIQPPIYPLWHFLESDKKLHPARIVDGRLRICLDNGRDTEESLYKKVEQAVIILEKLKKYHEWTPFIKLLKPILNDNESYWLLTAYLLRYEDYKDVEGYKLITYELLGLIEGASKADIVNKVYKAKPFITKYSQEVAHIELVDEQGEEYNVWTGKARRIKKVHFSDTIMEKFTEAQQYRNNKKNMSNYSTQKPWNKRKVVSEIEKTEKQIITGFKSEIELQEKLTYYLNTLPVNTFSTSIDLHYVDALQAILHSGNDIDHIKTQTAALNDIQEVYKQFYKNVEKTVRIYSSPYGAAIQNLPKYVRKSLFPEWIEIDLSNCHLAIAASLWKLDKINEVLTNGSVWDVLTRELNCKKEDIKQITNAFIKGYSLKKIREDMNNDELFENWKKHWIIRDLKEARTKALSEIKLKGGMTDVFGRFVTVDNADKHPEITVLSQVFDTYEMKLLEPVLIKAMYYRDSASRKNYGFKITLWSHDGCSIAMFNKNYTSDILKMLQKEVEKQAERLNITTALTFTS